MSETLPTNESITTRKGEYSQELLETDKPAARKIVSAIENNSESVIEEVTIARYEDGLLDITINGDLLIPPGHIKEAISDDPYYIKSIRVNENGGVTIYLP